MSCPVLAVIITTTTGKTLQGLAIPAFTSPDGVSNLSTPLMGSPDDVLIRSGIIVESLIVRPD